MCFLFLFTLEIQILLALDDSETSETMTLVERRDFFSQTV